jgi:excinuclease ABC subunit C
VGKITEKEYKEIVDDLILFLKGEKGLLLKSLSKKMRDYAGQHRYEEAAQARDQLAALTRVAGTPSLKKMTGVLHELAKTLRLRIVPLVIEAYDISNIFGKWAVGSMVCFNDGIQEKNLYRRFKIRMVEGIDDYAMIREVLRRRFSGSLMYQLKLPDLILIDGGRGHLSAALEVLEKLAIPIPIVSIAKKQELIFVPYRKTALRLERSSSELQLIQRVRDEAHRFAITHHRDRRDKRGLVSALDAIPGIGPSRKKALRLKFGDVDSIRNASIEELMKVRGINETVARTIKEHL